MTCFQQWVKPQHPEKTLTTHVPILMRISVSDLCTVLLCLVSFPSTGLCSPVSWSTRRCCLLATMCTVCASRRSPGWSVCNLQVHCHEERLFTANREDNYRQKKPSWRSKLIYSTSVLLPTLSCESTLVKLQNTFYVISLHLRKILHFSLTYICVIVPVTTITLIHTVHVQYVFNI